MPRRAARFAELFRHYVLRRTAGGPSTAAFWYLPEPPRVVSAAALSAYRDSAKPAPKYLLDYAAKLRYRLAGSDGIIRLNYDPPTGPQVNPEAAFQYALGLLDAGHREPFLHYARYFRDDQDSAGCWAYRFPWFASPPPWYSALAQSRGASVMLRAWLLTSESGYRDAAVAAISGFAQPLARGGFLAVHPRAPVEYFEEYPLQPTAVVNGFMASLFGLWELGEWLGDQPAAALFARGLNALESLLPVYTTSWWTLYDCDPESPMPNVNSVRYHRLIVDYLTILNTVAPRPLLAEYLARWTGFDTPTARIRATGLKLVKKISHR